MWQMIQNHPQERNAVGYVKSSIFLCCYLFITLVCSIDVYWSIRIENLISGEKNPVGVWLINLDSGSVALFMAVKLFGTVLATSFLVWFLHYRSDLCLAVIVPLALLALSLLYYLYFG